MNQLLTCLSAIIIDGGQQEYRTKQKLPAEDATLKVPSTRTRREDRMIKLTEACLSDQMLFLLLARIGVIQMVMQPCTKDIRSLFGEISTALLVPVLANFDVVELYLLP